MVLLGEGSRRPAAIQQFEADVILLDNSAVSPAPIKVRGCTLRHSLILIHNGKGSNHSASRSVSRSLLCLRFDMKSLSTGIEHFKTYRVISGVPLFFCTFISSRMPNDHA